MLENGPKQELEERFQMERIAMFSDAVFAIAITLLIIEIHVPGFEGEITDAILAEHLRYLIPKFCGFLISFFVIGQYWSAHHRMFRYVQRSEQKLLFNNLFFLMPIVVMPFSTAFLSEYFNGALHLPLATYAANICLAGVLNYRLWRIIVDQAQRMDVPVNKVIVLYNSFRALTVPTVFLILTAVSFASATLAYVMLPMLLMIGWAIRHYFKKKYPNIMNAHLA